MKSVKRMFVVLGAVLAVGLAANSSALAAGCSPGCGDHDMQAAQAGHEGHEGHAAPAQAASEPATAKAPPVPVPAVLDQYAKIQSALASDRLDGVPAAAQAINKLAADDPNKTLPAEVSTQADALARAKDLKAARVAFKPLSAALIQQLEKGNVHTGRYYQIYCSMEKASWLQTDKAIANPYLGASMSRCGEVTRTF